MCSKKFWYFALISFYIVAEISFSLSSTASDAAVTIRYFLLYLLIILLIWINKRNLGDFFLDKFTIILIVISPILKVLLPGNSVIYFASALIAFFFGLILFLNILPEFHNLSGIRLTFWLFLPVSIIIGFVLNISNWLIVVLINIGSVQPVLDLLIPSPNINVNIIVANFIYQLAHVSVVEETVFRGFLWGYLRRTEIGAVWSWLIQAALFWLIHIYKWLILGDFVSFLFGGLGFGLVVGLLVWRSRSVTTGILSHATYNTTNGIINMILSQRINGS